MYFFDIVFVKDVQMRKILNLPYCKELQNCISPMYFLGKGSKKNPEKVWSFAKPPSVWSFFGEKN